MMKIRIEKTSLLGALTTFVLLFAVAVGDAKAQLPSISLKDIDGNSIKTDTLAKSGKPIIISFFATWCKPCLRELNAIAEVYEEWQEETGVELIAVSIDEGANSLKVKPLVVSQEWNFKVLLDTNKEFMRAMNVSMVPALFLIDKKGKIVYTHTGYNVGAEQKLYKEVKKCIQ
ncbi:MAG: TlpA disulfide reductase family protein [Bacteroides sp.]|nr:TlpA disulfide reductase family protein [Bacteroides sp.]